MDELGRIVIPKEIRRTLNFKEGSDIEIILSGDDLILRKFSGIGNIISEGEKVLESLYETIKCPCIITDTERVILTKGVSQKEFLNQKLGKAFCDGLLEAEQKGIEIVDGKKIDAFIAPVFSQSFWCGSIVVIGLVAENAEVVKFAANFLSGLLV